ncbi:MAG: PAS domain S-box protein [Sandaracinaceae bacterium]|nr:PAS domain S-box protein [Sandaracinaceae bacterium]
MTHVASAPQPALEALVRHLPVAAALFDREMRHLAYSQAWVDAYRVTGHEVLGRTIYELLPEIRDEWREIHRECLGGKPMRRERDVFPRADGTLDYTRWSIVPWREASGEVGGLVVYTELITDAVLARQELAKREDFIKDLFEKSQVGLNLCRMDGLWLESNPAFLDLIGYTRAEADGGLTYWQLTPRKYDRQEEEQLESLRRTGRYGPYEKELIRKDGTLVPVRLNGFLVERGGEQFIWSLIEDIRERRRLEDALEDERAKALHAAKLATMGEMAAGFAHEINNPLSIIDAYAFELPSAIARGDSQLVDEALASIREAVHRAGRIVSGLRRYACESEHGTCEEVPVRALIRDALDLCEARMRNHGVRLDIEVDTDRKIFCNRIELSQVLINLLNNAFDAVRERPDPRVWVRARELELGEVEITVEDSGPGVAPADEARLFQPFFTTKRPGEGTGLGLSISHGIVRSNGGSIRYARQDERTRFVVVLPVRDA